MPENASAAVAAHPNFDRLEEVMRRMRAVAREAGRADRFFFSDHSHCRSSLDNLCLLGEGQWDFQQFYRRPNPSDTKSLHVSVPHWVRLSCEDRLSWGEVLPRMLEAVKGLAVSVSVSPSWRWDHQNLRTNGRPTYVPVYEALICLAESKAAFDPEKLCQALAQSHCMALHPLADQHLFDWQVDEIGRTLFSSYCWRAKGFVATFHSKASVEEAQQSLFKGMPVSIEKQGKGKEASWAVTVDLTAAR